MLLVPVNSIWFGGIKTILGQKNMHEDLILFKIFVNFVNFSWLFFVPEMSRYSQIILFIRTIFEERDFIRYSSNVSYWVGFNEYYISLPMFDEPEFKRLFLKVHFKCFSLLHIGSCYKGAYLTDPIPWEIFVRSPVH